MEDRFTEKGSSRNSEARILEEKPSRIMTRAPLERMLLVSYSLKGMRGGELGSTR